jgi:alkanesulfonate monooxygenase SsuD/methylene tetrahydromethanopterin reductase-like flavin-dependent oxidoreductase (luciferase family)
MPAQVVRTTLPPQAWAHRQGKISMRPLEPADWSPDAMAARAQIAEAFNRFGTAHDEARIDVVVSCFTADTVFEVAEGQAEAFTRFEGRAELFDRLTGVVAEQADQRRHVLGNILIEELDLGRGTAAALAYSVVTVAADGLSLGAAVLYDTRLRREDDGCWRFSYFFVGLDTYAGEKPAAGEKPPTDKR